MPNQPCLDFHSRSALHIFYIFYCTILRKFFHAVLIAMPQSIQMLTGPLFVVNLLISKVICTHESNIESFHLILNLLYLLSVLVISGLSLSVMVEAYDMTLSLLANPG